jgi:hypothetical protein
MDGTTVSKRFSSNRFMFLITMYYTMPRFSATNHNNVTYFTLIESIKLFLIVFRVEIIIINII